ncbi:N-6 DNA methylase [Clostridium sp. A1-XYC3]|uniref:site-specific DNA-methyltransferase (adenine-specific) n=1 Tax=Clostridium tanneri TaxID=3037988 RepID=A0ABU4JNW2_9CLOT|nr:N-6 DNA methylase [Clostridium sp. A1-XYC3]MDW8799792.1 N-6 DNA methylase [Clostridium sp. A1-XYC3]
MLGEEIIKNEGVFGAIYEKLTDRDIRKSMGMFYTPDFIIDYILKNTVSKADVVKNPFVKILDPACGAGYFLVKAYDILKNKFITNLKLIRELYADETYYIEEYSQFNSNYTTGDRGKSLKKVKGNDYWTEEIIHYHILKNCLYGADLDPVAVAITKNNLIKKGNEKLEISFNIVQCDSLLKWEQSILHKEHKVLNDIFRLQNKYSNRSEEIDSYQVIEKLSNFWSNEFDYIIGNPPYVMMLKSETSETYWKYILNKYNTVGYKKNIFYLLMERSLEKLKPGGMHGFIIPDRYFFASSYISSRCSLVRNAKLLSVTQFSSKIFKDAIVGTAVYILEKSKYEDNHEISLKLDYIDEENFCRSQVSQKEIAKDEKCIINILTKLNYKSIIEKIKINSLELKEFCNIHVGMMIKNKEKNFKDAYGMTNRDRIALGRDLGKYTIENNDRYCYLQGMSVFGGTKKIEKHRKNPKILLRKTGSSIVASLDKEGTFAEQSVYMIIPFEEDDVYNLLGQIQSKLSNFYFIKALITNPEAYPYIQHYDLERIPIHREVLSSNIYSEIIKKIVNLKEDIKSIKFSPLIMKNSYEDILGEYRILKNEEKRLREELNVCVKSSNEILYAAYQLSEKEIELIENCNTNCELREIDEYNTEHIKYYEGLINEIYREIKTKSVNILSHVGKYLAVKDLERELAKAIPNIDVLIEILKEHRFDKKEVCIIREVLNLCSDSWSKYVKEKVSNKKGKELVRYSKNEYGLTLWTEEVHNIWFKDKGK